jgi:hypothetical protein
MWMACCWQGGIPNAAAASIEMHRPKSVRGVGRGGRSRGVALRCVAFCCVAEMAVTGRGVSIAAPDFLRR